MKRILSLCLSLLLVLSLFTGITVQAANEEAALTVYTQVGEGEKVLAKAYSAAELKALAQSKEDGYGYLYYKNNWQAVVATEYVTLDALLTDAGTSFTAGSSLHFTCSDGEYGKFEPTYEDLSTGKYYIDEKGSSEVPAAIAITWNNGALADGSVAEIAKTAKDSGSLRFVCGITEEEYSGTSAAGKRMPSGVVAITVVTPAEKLSFIDVTEKDWFYSAVTYCAEKALLLGVSENSFAPKSQMNMASLVTLLYRVDGNTTDNSGEKWYSKQQAWAAEKNVVAASDFEASAKVDRSAFITMFYKTLALNEKYDTKVTDEMREALKKAADYSAIRAEDLDAVAWAVSVGLIQGTGSELTISPDAQVNRAQAATMLQRYYTVLAK